MKLDPLDVIGWCLAIVFIVIWASAYNFTYGMH